MIATLFRTKRAANFG
jgi:hypothetical protein